MTALRSILMILGIVLGAWAAVIGLGGLALLAIGAPFSVGVAACVGFALLFGLFAVVSLFRAGISP